MSSSLIFFSEGWILMGVHFKYAFISGTIEPGESKKVYIDLGTKDIEITAVHLFAPALPGATQGDTLLYLDCEPAHNNYSGFAVPKHIPNLNILVAQGSGSEKYGKVETRHFESSNQIGKVWGQENFPFYATGRLALNYHNNTDGTLTEDRAVAVSIIYRDI
jgi:hypothetical protein